MYVFLKDQMDIVYQGCNFFVFRPEFAQTWKSWRIDLFSLYVLLPHFRPRDVP